MSYTLFLGCVIPTRFPSYELSVRNAMKKFGVDLNDLSGATCCAPIPIESVDYTTSLAITAYNLCLAEETNKDLMPICNGCYQALSKANSALKSNEKLKNSTNKILAKVGKEYKGTIAVKDYLQVLCDDIGFKKIGEKITEPLKNLKVAVFYGCHLLKPSSILSFDDPERPHILDELVELTGATSVPYMYKTKCCGSLLRGVSDELANKLARDKLYHASQAGADCIVTVCPSCFLQLDVGQLIVSRKFNESYNLPVLHYPELLALAMGINPKEIGLHTHRICTDSIIKR
jgi:heterodisulfide reductase subunit B